MDMDLEALAIEVRDLEGEGCMEPESHARDGGAGDVVVEGGGGREEPPDLLNTQPSGETVCSGRTQEREGVPVALEDMLREESHATGAEAHGRWGEAVDVFAVEEGGLECLFGDHVRRFAIELSQQTDCTDRGFLRTFALAAQLKRRNHVLTQVGHTMSSF
jgi:hypothetical protein